MRGAAGCRGEGDAAGERRGPRRRRRRRRADTPPSRARPPGAPPAPRVPGSQAHARGATPGPERLRGRAGAPEVTSAQPPLAPALGAPLCRAGAVTPPSFSAAAAAVGHVALGGQPRGSGGDTETVSLGEPRILPRRGIRCPRAGRGARCRGSACSRFRVARVPHARAAPPRGSSFWGLGGTCTRPSPRPGDPASAGTAGSLPPTVTFFPALL